MKAVITLLVLLITSVATSQVGINTNLPDPSAMLDISSDDKGLLVPRMTTAERLLITAPADGLMVYDTDLQDFKYFTSGDWNYIGRSQIRDNYKLVKNISDLSDELIAGSGSQYLLNTDFLYEINGSVTFDFPINLNGAYVEGVDSGEDVIINASGAAFFQGTSGGSLRNLTVSGNGNPIFDITGSGTELLVSNNTIYVGASSVGTLDSLGTVFFSIAQFVGNTDGLAVSNMGTFLMSNVFWTASNSGTFITFSGTFNNLQMSSGRIEADAGEIAVDVSANPTINNDATLSQLSFVGAGTYVNPYTIGSYAGYNFTKDWNVNCSGLSLETDQAATGNFYFNGALTSGFSQAIGGAPEKIQGDGTFTATDLFRFSSTGPNNELVYEGKKVRNVQVNVSLSIRVTGAVNDFYAFAIAKNGSIATETNSIVNIFNNTQIQNVALNGILTLNPGDTLSVFVDRLTNNDTTSDLLVVFSENLSVN